MSWPVCSTSLREVPQTVAPARVNVSQGRNHGSLLETGRIAGTEDERGDSESHDGVQGVAGDAAWVLAVSNEAHVPAFPPTGPPTEKSFKKKTCWRNCCWHGAVVTMVLFPGPVFDEPVVLSSLRTIADQQHRVAQIVRVTVRLLIYSWGRELCSMHKN